MKNKMTDNTIVVKDRTADSLLDLLETTQDMSYYFDSIDLHSVDRGHVEYWIEELLRLWKKLEDDYDSETDRNDILYQLSLKRSELPFN